jgi:beta-glucosidase
VSGDDDASDAPDGTLDGSTQGSLLDSSEASTLEEASSNPEAAASSDAIESADVSVDGSAPPDAGQGDAGAGVCGEGTPLSRTAWATNPGTTASDNLCGIVNLFDGELTTRWSTNRLQTTSPAEWLEVDLGCLQTFSEIVLDATDDGSDYPRGYTVQVSTDDNTWTQVARGTGSTALMAVTFASTTARYVRINQTGTSTSNFWSIDKLNICGTTGGICGSPTAYSRAGWTTNPGTTASDNAKSIGNMFDGAIGTSWTTGRLQVTSPSEWVEIDMGISQPVSQVTLQTFAECNDYPRGYALGVSLDNATWTPPATGAGSSPVTNITFPSTMARYIKITQTGSSSMNFWSIDELYVYH